MENLAGHMIDLSIRIMEQGEDSARQKYYERLQDHYDRDLEKYFEKFYAESEKRFKERPKKVLPLCASVLEVLTSAALGDGISVKISDENSDAMWQEIEQANSFNDQYALMLGETVGLFGWAISRVKPSVYPITDPGQIEFEVVDPRTYVAEYNRASVGSSRRTIGGVAFHTMYDPDQGRILPRDTSLSHGGSIKKRVEVITPEVWQVYLEGEPSPVDEYSGDQWVPMMDGSNPFKTVMAVPFWNVWRPGSFEGRSDIDPAFHEAEAINESYSQLIYNILHYFPTLIAQSGDIGAKSPETRGIGLTLRYPKNSTPPGYIIPGLNINVLMDPIKMQLNLFFSQAHTPASSHGLGTIFGESTGAESGKAKHYEFLRMRGHVAKKRRNFTAGIKQTYRVVAEGLTAAGVKGMDPDATVTVDYLNEIVPVSWEEKRDGIILEMEKGVRSVLSAVMAVHGITDPEVGQQMVDEIAVQATRATPLSRLEAGMIGRATDEES